MIGKLIRMGLEAPVRGHRLAKSALQIGREGWQHREDFLEIGKGLFNQREQILHNMKVVMAHSDEIHALVRLAEENDMALSGLLKTLQANPKLLATMADLGENQSTADVLAALQQHPELLDFVKDLSQNPDGLQKLMRLATMLTEGQSTLKIFKALHTKKN